MKNVELRFNRRYNVGQYEHEDYTIVAQLEEGDSSVEALAQMKASVEAAFAGESGGEPGADAADKPATTGKGKKDKKSKPAPTTTQEEEEETEEIEEETGGEETEEETETEEEVETEETEEEETETEEEEIEDPPPKKGKTFKKKPQAYQRENKTHKDIFSSVLKKVAPKWKSSFESKAHAKKVSQKLNGKDFLDENGKVLSSFEAEAKKLMGKFGK